MLWLLILLFFFTQKFHYSYVCSSIATSHSISDPTNISYLFWNHQLFATVWSVVWGDDVTLEDAMLICRHSVYSGLGGFIVALMLAYVSHFVDQFGRDCVTSEWAPHNGRMTLTGGMTWSSHRHVHSAVDHHDSRLTMAMRSMLIGWHGNTQMTNAQHF